MYMYIEDDYDESEEEPEEKVEEAVTFENQPTALAGRAPPPGAEVFTDPASGRRWWWLSDAECGWLEELYEQKRKTENGPQEKRKNSKPT